jgi:hypothetical protein
MAGDPAMIQTGISHTHDAHDFSAYSLNSFGVTPGPAPIITHTGHHHYTHLRNIGLITLLIAPLYRSAPLFVPGVSINVMFSMSRCCPVSCLFINLKNVHSLYLLLNS